MAKVQLWQLVSGQMIPAGTEFSVPLTRVQAMTVSQWFRTLEREEKALRWQDVLAHFKQGGTRNALLTVTESYLSVKFVNWEEDEELATPEHIFQLLWPVEATKYSFG